MQQVAIVGRGFSPAFQLSFRRWVIPADIFNTYGALGALGAVTETVVRELSLCRHAGTVLISQRCKVLGRNEGLIAGLVGAVAIGIALFQFGIRINLKVFFQAMGVFLLLIVAGLVVSAIGHLDKAIAAFAELSQTSICFPASSTTEMSSCLLGGLVWDVHDILPDKQFPGILLKALFGFRDRLFFGQAIAYFTFLISAGFLYFQSLTGKPISKQPS